MDPLGASTEAASLAHALEHAGHLLPAQGPLSVFIHHNTLHAFEHLPFHEAVTTASRLYETEPYFTETRFRDLYAAGRIADADLDGVLERWWQATPPPPVGPFAVRSLHRMALHNPIACETAAGLVWQLTEGDAGHRFRSDVPQAMRLRIIARSAGDAPAHGTRGWVADDDEARAVALLWAECRRIPIADSHVARPAPLPRSHRDALLALTGEDANDLVHPVVGRLAAAFLDEGTASWALPARDEGFFRAWCAYVAEHRSPTPTWQKGLRAEVAAHVAAGRDAGEVVLHGLHELGVAPEQFADYLTRVLLHLRGWAGIFHWFEERPQEAITVERQVRLLDFLAVRLTYDRFAWRDVARRHLGPGTDLAALPWRTPERMDERGESRPEHDGAWRLFQCAQLAGLAGTDVARLSGADRAWILDQLDRFDELTRRQVWQEAYEAHYRTEVLEALAFNRTRPEAARSVAEPRFQVVCCLDEREESFRRHFEELDPRHETFGTAGFYGWPSSTLGSTTDTRCPSARSWSRRRTPCARCRSRGTRRTPSDAWSGGGVCTVPGWGRATRRMRCCAARSPRLSWVRWRPSRCRRGCSRPVGGPGSARGSTTACCRSPRPASTAPATTTTPPNRSRPASPSRSRSSGWRRRWRTLASPAAWRAWSSCWGTARSAPTTRTSPPMTAAHAVDGMAAPMRGSSRRWSTALTCARACWPGASTSRTTTWFVGGLHNTSDCAVDLFDLDQVPETHASDLDAVRAALDDTRARSAQERCRRFDSAPPDPMPAEALRHVEARAQDLAEPRPELGHATNAVCIVGRRSLTRGIFYDRRSFLVSYDPIDRSGRRASSSARSRRSGRSARASASSTTSRSSTTRATAAAPSCRTTSPG